MKWLVYIRPVAKTDLAEARTWYERRRPGLGDEFLASMADLFTRLEEAPEQFPFYYRELRRALSERFPYKVFFRIENNTVVVLRILHAAREHRSQLDEH